MAHLLFLGSGSAFTVGGDNFHSNMFLITETGKKLLIDCGSDLRFSLYKEGFSHRDITDIYISHLHSDHAGGLEYVGLTTKFDPQCDQPNLYLSYEIATEIWEHTLSGGMGSVEGEITNLESFFNVHSIDNNRHFVWETINFELVKTIHINNGTYVMPSYGLFFSVNNQKIFITSDTQLCYEKLQKYYQEADIIFHDCEISKYPTPVHSHYQQLVKLPDNIKQKIWLYGYQPRELPNAKADGFLGFVKRGDQFLIN
ncbi:MBL fold metallo-hydrolase [Cyanothece sp. BG0011]|uniref:MBL fold metallo-hydrolase n=1 Tax=Cyanothece sp. BG0011 TaxID=2082950 RepID=UPI000D1E5743|nr:MBL fold metallo-hydrolase [Cyanothece sp. BG0011]